MKNLNLTNNQGNTVADIIDELADTFDNWIHGENIDHIKFAKAYLAGRFEDYASLFDGVDSAGVIDYILATMPAPKPIKPMKELINEKSHGLALMLQGCAGEDPKPVSMARAIADIRKTFLLSDKFTLIDGQQMADKIVKMYRSARNFYHDQIRLERGACTSETLAYCSYAAAFDCIYLEIENSLCGDPVSRHGILRDANGKTTDEVLDCTLYDRTSVGGVLLTIVNDTINNEGLHWGTPIVQGVPATA